MKHPEVMFRAEISNWLTSYKLARQSPEILFVISRLYQSISSHTKWDSSRKRQTSCILDHHGIHKKLTDAGVRPRPHPSSRGIITI
jgi:hypothetical protein